MKHPWAIGQQMDGMEAFQKPKPPTPVVDTLPQEDVQDPRLTGLTMAYPLHISPSYRHHLLPRAWSMDVHGFGVLFPHR